MFIKKLLLENRKLIKELKRAVAENISLKEKYNPEKVFVTRTKTDKLVLEGYNNEMQLYKVQTFEDMGHWYGYYVPFSERDVRSNLNRQFMLEHNLKEVPELIIRKVGLSIAPPPQLR